jgi:hypothetical protein
LAKANAATQTADQCDYCAQTHRPVHQYLEPISGVNHAHAQANKAHTGPAK